MFGQHSPIPRSWQPGYEPDFTNQKYTTHKCRFKTSGSKKKKSGDAQSSFWHWGQLCGVYCMCLWKRLQGRWPAFAVSMTQGQVEASVPSRDSMGIHQGSSSSQSEYSTATEPRPFALLEILRSRTSFPVCSLLGHTRLQVQQGSVLVLMFCWCLRLFEQETLHFLLVWPLRIM